MATLYTRPGSPYYWTRFKVAGKTHRCSTRKTNLREAKSEAKRLERRANAYVYTADDIRLDDAIERLDRDNRLKPRSIDSYHHCFGYFRKILGNFPLRILDANHIDLYISTRRLTVGDATIRKELASLSTLYRITGIPNPLKNYDTTVLGRTKELTRWLRVSQFEHLLSHCRNDNQRHMLILLVDTGLRVGEAMSLAWSEVDFNENRIVLGNLDASRTKRGDIRAVPLTSRLRDALSTRERTSPWVFPSKRNHTGHIVSIDRWWYRLRIEAGMPNVRIHDLRHTFASWALQSGMSEILVQDLLGHSTRSMTKRYAKTSEQQRQSAIVTFEESTKLSTVERNANL